MAADARNKVHNKTSKHFMIGSFWLHREMSHFIFWGGGEGGVLCSPFCLFLSSLCLKEYYTQISFNLKKKQTQTNPSFQHTNLLSSTRPNTDMLGTLNTGECLFVCWLVAAAPSNMGISATDLSACTYNHIQMDTADQFVCWLVA